MENWNKVKIGDVCTINSDSYSSKDKWQYVNYLDTGNITQNKIDSIQYINLNNEKLPSRAKRKVKTNSVIYSTVRPNQLHFGIIKNQPNNFLVSTGFTVIDVDADILDADYLYYFLSQPSVINTLQSIAEQSTSAYPSIKSSDLEELEIEIPSLKNQKKISSVLRCLDNKISQNKAINQNLEQQAQLLYSSWFERFEPFDNVIPEDWNIGLLSDIAKINTKSFNPAKNPDVMLEHYSIPAFDEKRFPIFELSDEVKSNKYVLSSNSIMASKLNPNTKRVWRPICITDKAVCSTEFIVFEALKSEWKDFVYSIIDSVNFSNWMCAHTTGSTGSRQRTTPSTTLEFEIVVPTEKVISEFCSIVTPMYDLIAENSKENYRLTMLRDFILPKLMSGEIDVSSLDI